MRTSVFISICCTLLLLLPLGMQLHAQPEQWSSGKNGVRFIENRGQIADAYGRQHPEVQYSAGARDMNLFFMQDRISYVFVRPSVSQVKGAALLSDNQPADSQPTLDLYRVDLQL